jgi:hypothetical protein
MGAYFGSPTPMKFPDPNHLGNHYYHNSIDEQNGMVYTCRGGFIDIGHVREAADRTAYLAEIAYENILQKNRKYSFQIIEPSKYHVTLAYPADWGKRTQQDREQAAKEVSIYMGQYLAHTSLIWHEIITWYGFSSTGIFPEYISAFSCEDTYSDILGTEIAFQALCCSHQTYEEAMAQLLERKLADLEVQSPETAAHALQHVKGKWYEGGFYFFVKIKKYNFDIGIDDGMISPMLVDDICPETEPHLYPIPNIEPIWEYGFNVEVEIEPLILEEHKIYHAVGLGKDSLIKPAIHFPRIMEQIEKVYK